jgi:hypothetical protein
MGAGTTVSPCSTYDDSALRWSNPMRKHEHCCQHELMLCPVCDVVYCKKCGKEWGQKEYYPEYYPYPYINPGWPYTYPVITYSANTSYHNHKEA